MSKTLFEALGYRLGRKAAQAKNAFDLMGGTDEESLRAEIRLGRDLSAALLERIPLVQENEPTKFAAQICDWLAAHVTEKQLPFRLWVTGERELNAIALPGGPVFVSWPLLHWCARDRDQIAFVLAHEMGHVVRRHTLNRLVKDAAVSLLLRRSSGKIAASAWFNNVGRQMLAAAFSKDDELEADRFARDLIDTAGGDPLGGERFLEKLRNQTSGREVATRGEYFSSHPCPAERLANLRQHS